MIFGYLKFDLKKQTNKKKKKKKKNKNKNKKKKTLILWWKLTTGCQRIYRKFYGHL